MKLLVGLGNPGVRYKFSRHNYGFLVLDELALKQGVQFSRRKFQSLIAETMLSGTPVIMLKPQTFMNLSGDAVQQAVQFYRIDIGDVIVVHDDLDLPFRTMRIRRGGGDGGNKGVASIIRQTGMRDFVRVRMGIDKPPRKEMTEDYVLGRFSLEEMEYLPDMLDRAAAAAEKIVSSSLNAAMNEFNRKPRAGEAKPGLDE